MSCGQLSSWFKGKTKESQTNDEQDYAYWVQMYNNAKARKLINRKMDDKNYGLAKFESIHSWLQEVGNDPDYVDIGGAYNYHKNYVHLYDYIEINTLEKPSSKKRLHSVINSDYSFWSLDDSKEVSCFSESDTQSEYCFQLRQQAHNLYMVL